MLLRGIPQNTTDRNIANFSVLLLILKKVPGKGAFSFLSSVNCISGILYLKFEKKIYFRKNIIEKRYFWPYETMVKFPSSVIQENWTISKSLLVTILKVTMKLHNVQIKCSISNLKEIYNKNWMHGICPKIVSVQLQVSYRVQWIFTGLDLLSIPCVTWSHLWFAGVRECPPWCSIVGAPVTVHQFFCILPFFQPTLILLWKCLYI